MPQRYSSTSLSPLQMLKRFAADTGSEWRMKIRSCRNANQTTGKSVAVIGGGPHGLVSMAYFLKSDGPCCDCIYESMPKARRYAPLWHPGISSSEGSARYWKSPSIEKLGVNHHNQYQRSALISPLIPFVQRSRRGTAWESEPGFPQASACKGEDADGVIGGIDFLRKVVRNEEIELGEKVAIVGGGNTGYGCLPYSSTSWR